MVSSSSHWRAIRVISCLLFLTAVILGSRAEAQQNLLPDGPGKAIFLQTCSTCHTPNNVIGKAQNADAWSDTLNKMIQYGLSSNDDDLSTILDYLTKNFGPAPDKINVNKATALNLCNWLNFTPKQANDFIAYRLQHGDFKSVDDLKKVPGVEAAKIDAKKNILTF
jgi:competence protein ComEA